MVNVMTGFRKGWCRRVRSYALSDISAAATAESASAAAGGGRKA